MPVSIASRINIRCGSLHSPAPYVSRAVSNIDFDPFGSAQDAGEHREPHQHSQARVLLEPQTTDIAMTRSPVVATVLIRPVGIAYPERIPGYIPLEFEQTPDPIFCQGMRA